MIVVHIGLKRCGSASIQHFLSVNERALRLLSVDYTGVGRRFRVSHANFGAELREGENFDSSLGSLSDLVKNWRSSESTLKVISSETFEGLDASQIGSLKRRLGGVGENVRIVMVIRDLPGMMRSLYLQRIKLGQKFFDFDRFFKAKMITGRIDYFEIARPWGEAFGWGNLRIRMLDAGTQVNGDLIDDFLSASDVDPDDPRLHSLVRPGPFNVTSDWHVLEAIRALHKGDIRLPPAHPLSIFLARADRKFDQRCVERVAIEIGERRGWVGDKGNFLTRQQAQRCLEVESKAVEALNERLAERLPMPQAVEAAKLPGRDFLPASNRIAPVELRAFYDEMGECFAGRAAIETAAKPRWRQAGLLVGPLDMGLDAVDENVDYPVVGGKRLVIHIGLKKSGSASIQNFLVSNEKVLRGLSIDYAPVGRYPRTRDSAQAPPLVSHHNFAKEAIGRQKFDAKVGSISELGEYVASTQHEIVIVSSEMLEGCEPEHVVKFRDLLGRTNRRIQITLVIRDLISLLPSSYAQKVRFGSATYDFDEFYDQRIAETRVDYFATAKAWADAFGWENINVRILDRRYLTNGDLIDDFLLTAGVKIDDVRVRTARRLGAVNETSGWKVLEATRALFDGAHRLEAEHSLAQFAASPRSLFARKVLESAAVEVGDRLGWLGDRGLYLNRAHAQQALGQFATAITQLNKYLPDPLPPPSDLDTRGFVDRPFLPSADRIPAAELRAFYDMLAEAWPLSVAKRKAANQKKLAIKNKIMARREARKSA